MIQDKTHKVKVRDTHDAVIYVYERHYRQKTDPKDAEKKIYWSENDVIAVVSVDKDYNITDDDFIERVMLQSKLWLHSTSMHLIMR